MTDRQNRLNKAEEMFIKGYNCAQATAAPFYDLAGIDENTLIKAISAFGGGVAKMKNVCGVASGVAMIYGLCREDGDLYEPAVKSKMYEESGALIKKFSDKNGTAICSALLKEFETNPPKEEVYKEKPCLKLVLDGVTILCDYLGIA